MPSGPYYLLTGATGLLGRYLLRDLLCRGARVAVVVRGTKHATGRERADSILAELEEAIGRVLPRPVVLEGELLEEDLGLEGPALDWTRRNVKAIIHNAASLSFDSAPRDQEPWRSNLGGTARTLELARRLGVEEFHHVSTAYVCGDRRGRILESDLNLGQTFGNDYEQSKLEAESMVRNAGIPSCTVYRPAIIVGDSRTGYTSTFHGFYTPLNIVHASLGLSPSPEMDPFSFADVLGMTGEECKNLVPVDWVSAVTVHLLCNPRHHGQTYHLTPPTPTTISLLCEVYHKAIVEYVLAASIKAGAAPAAGFNFAGFAERFREQMESYRAYWRDDPRFDASNTLSHAGHLPCPDMSRELLLRLCRYAIGVNFWSSRGTALATSESAFNVLAGLADSTVEKYGGSPEASLNLRVLGVGGGDWQLDFVDRQLVAAQVGGGDGGTVCILATAFSRIVSGQVSWSDLLRDGSATLASRGVPPSELLHLLEETSWTPPDKLRQIAR